MAGQPQQQDSTVATTTVPSQALVPNAAPTWDEKSRKFWDIANAASKSNFAPKEMRGKPAECYLAIVKGDELGMQPTAALQNIAVINGRTAVWGDAMLAICMASPLFDHDAWKEWWTGTEGEDDWTAHCRARRRGQGAPIERSFSLAEAKQAGLLDKNTPWPKYTKRMLQMRARGWDVRDTYPDLLSGMHAAEELLTVDDLIDRLDLGDSGVTTASPDPVQDLEQQLLQGANSPSQPAGDGNGARIPDSGPEASPPVAAHDAEVASDPEESAGEPESANTPELDLLRTQIKVKFDQLDKAAQRRVQKGFVGLMTISDVDGAGWTHENLIELNSRIDEELSEKK